MVLVLISFSCTKLIDIDIPDKGRKIVVNGVLKVNEPVVLTVSLSQPMTMDSRMTRYVVNKENVGVKITSQDGIEKKLLSADYETYKNQFCLDSTFLEAGKEYIVEVASANLPTVKTSVKIPMPIEIDSILYMRKKFSDGFGYTDDGVKFLIKFTDPPNERNYYMLTARRTGIEEHHSPNYPNLERVYINNTLSFEPDDPILDYNSVYYGEGTKVFFSDEFFDGETYELGVWAGIWEFYMSGSEELPKVHFNLYSITKDYYQYARTYNAYKDLEDNPLAEPVQVYTNVENGLGIIGGASSSTDSIEVRVF